MKKWADFLISAVRFSEERNNKVISYLKVHQDIEFAVGAGFTWSREEFMRAIKEGKTFYTIYKKNNGDWKKGNTVNIVRANGGMVITDDENLYQDHLSHLLEL